jgi:uncharacterized membrane protein YdbT with pleckstrin-like domain
MSYARSILQSGETIIVIGKLHWIIYRWAILSLFAGVLMVWLEHAYFPARETLAAVTALTFGVLFLTTFAFAWFIRWITEFAVTDRRVVSSRVFISRRVEEMNMEKVETVDIDQTVLGRILGYGSMRITGTGGSNTIVVRNIAHPLEVRAAIIPK